LDNYGIKRPIEKANKHMRTLRKRYFVGKFTGILLAFVFASIGFAVHTFETWIPSLEVKAREEAPVTVRLPARYFRITMLRNEFHYLSTTSSSCPHLVARGTKLKRGGECSGLVKAFEKHKRNPSNLQLVGIFLFYFVVGFLLSDYMKHQRMEKTRLLRAQATILGLLSLIMIISKIILLFTALPAPILPVVTVPLISANLFKRPFSLIIALVTALVTASIINFDIEVLVIFLFSGIGAAVSQKDRFRAWTQLKGGAFASWVAVITTVITTLVFSGTLDVYDDMSEHFDPRFSLWISGLLGGLSSGVMALLLTPLASLMVGEVSRNKLLDLQDLNQRLLTRLRERAPGTWEHSRAMANLAEAATNAIGGNALLARVGAYYHDMGKSNYPEFFIENQGGGPNPHDDLESDESASRIFRHVADGTKLLRMEGIPEDIIEFCYSHHGTSLLEYFWYKNMAAGNPGEMTERDFSYPGHKPTTRETGIVMVVDAIEAGARTVDVPEKSALQDLVQQIVFSKLSQGQLDETGLSLADLRIVVNTLVDTLINMYHARIKYPWQKTGDTGSIKIPTDSQNTEESNPNQTQSEQTANGSDSSANRESNDQTGTVPVEQGTPIPAARPIATPIPSPKPPAVQKNTKPPEPIVVNSKTPIKTATPIAIADNQVPEDDEQNRETPNKPNKQLPLISTPFEMEPIDPQTTDESKSKK
jgi:putative nucleotidyltransferase with HDIG domain